jgi:hypothetical protein
MNLLLSDVELNNGATAFIPGSVDPRWDCLFEEPFRLRKNPDPERACHLSPSECLQPGLQIQAMERLD